MTDDLRDRLASLANEVNERPDAFERLRRHRERRARRRRLAAASLALAIATGSTAALVRAFGRTSDGVGTDTSPTVTDEPPLALTRTYTDELGWSVDYPDGWHVLPIDYFDGRVNLTGVALSNEPLVPAGDEGFGGEPLPDLSTLTHDGVVLIVTHRSGGPAPTIEDDSRYPLDPSAAQIIPGPSPASAVLGFRGDGLGDFTARFGGYADGPPELYDALDRMIQTIRFEPWELGDARNGFAAILGDVPEGSGVSDLVEQLGLIYEMRIEGVLYVLDVPNVSCEGQNQTWDPDTRQILLEGPCYADIRYDVDGVPDPSNPPEYQQTLDRHPVIRAWDGTPLVALGATQ